MQESIFVRDLAIVLIVAAFVGWAAQRIRLSSVVGYLLAGVLIGPFSPAVKIVSNIDNVQLLSQIGLIFLMFAIGMGLSFARLQRMGFSVLLAVAISSILIFNAARWFGSAMGWNAIQIIFLAGTMMISSSAIIIKVLDDLNITHQRAGQLAVGITVLEDIVSVVMLTIFISMIKIGSSDASTPLAGVLGALAAFVVFLVVIAMLLVPRLLKLLSRDPASELRVIAVTGFVLLAAVAAYQAGYSFALGAFVMGVVVAGTRYKDEIDGGLAALHTIFGAVFFVAVGMLFDFRLLANVWWLVLLVTALTVVTRTLACGFGLIAAGHSSKNAIQAGLALTAVGEFAFVMIQVGKSANVLPESFYALGIGVSLATAIVGPLLTRHSERIATAIDSRQPKPLRDLIDFYHRWLETVQIRSNASVLWRLVSRRVFQAAFHLLFVSALILFSKPAYDLALKRFGQQFPSSFAFLYWSLFFVIILGPVIVLWRNLEALAMIIAEGATARSTRSNLLRPLLQTLLKTISAIVLVAWLLVLLPIGPAALWALAVASAVILFYAPRFWRRLVSLHAKVEIDLREKIKTASTLGSSTGLPASVLEQPQQWNLQIDEVTLPLGSEHAGRRIADLAIRRKFACSIMTIDRQGCLITNPTADERLFSGDKLLVLGAPTQLSQTEQFLRSSSGPRSEEFANITMETFQIPKSTPLAGQTLAQLNPITRFNIQICAIERNGARILVPASTETLHSGDTLLVLGSNENIQSFFLELTGANSL